MNNLIYILIFCVSCVNSSNDNLRKTNAKYDVVKKDTLEDIQKNDTCAKCNEFYLSFPKDSLSFENMYSLETGKKYHLADVEIEYFFSCLKECYKIEHLREVLKLSILIRFDADAPSYLQTSLINIVINNNESITPLYNEMPCKDFKKHIQFLFAGAESLDFIESFKNNLNSLELMHKCHKKAINEVISEINLNDH